MEASSSSYSSEEAILDKTFERQTTQEEEEVEVVERL